MSSYDTTPAGSGDPRLDGLWLFGLMPAAIRRLIEAAMTRLSFSAGEVIVSEGETADAYYVLVFGTVSATATTDGGEEIALGEMSPGDAFGERALIEEGTRTATLRASSPVEVLRLDRAVFRALIRTNPGIEEYVHQAVHRHELRSFIRLQTDFGRLPSDEIDALLDGLRPTWVAAGERVIREGDAAGAMYVVRTGQLRAFSGPADAEQEHRVLQQGDLFGERSLILAVPRSASVEAITNCELLVLTSDVFRRLSETEPRFRERVQERIADYENARSSGPPATPAEVPPGTDTEAQTL
jgi:CRP-like cAMP-binding protein